jgi:sugar lactone lactonase YvrE
MVLALFLAVCVSLPAQAETVIVSTLAGSGKQGSTDDKGSAARFNVPTDITIDAAGNLYVTDEYNQSIRKITPEGKVSTLAGGGFTPTEEGSYANGQGKAARFNCPSSIAIDRAGNLYVADAVNHRIRKIVIQSP